MVVKLRNRSALISLMLFTGCAGNRTEAPEAKSIPAPTQKQLENATYDGLQLAGGAVTLQDGKWEQARTQASLVRHFRVTGDLDGDGAMEAAAILTESGGGSGVLGYIALVGFREGKLTNLATVPLGDRVQVRGVRILPKRVEADVIQAGPGDPVCCPGDMLTRAWSYEGAGLLELPRGPAERFALGALDRTNWVLRGWDLETAAPPEPEVTLSITGTGFTGFSGCNSYSASVKSGYLGQLEVGPPAATQKACGAEAMKVERQLLDRLPKVTAMSFVDGRLALSYSDGARTRGLIFEAANR